MKFFFRKILIFLLLPVCFLFIGIILPAYPGATSTYLFAKLDKDRMLQYTKSDRIVLVGGSNLALSINSRLLVDSLRLNPVNTGLDCNIGLENMIENTLAYIHKGDIVLLSIEYEQFFGRLIYGGYPCPVIEFEVSPGQLQKLSFNQWLNLLRYTPGYAFNRLKVWKYLAPASVNPEGNYMRTSFNQYGDHVSHWNSKSGHPVPTNGFEGVFNQNAVNILVAFQAKLSQKHAYMLITYPPYQSSSFDNNKAQIEQVATALNAAKLNIISIPERYRMADSLMFDSPYHLIKEGVDKRTQLLIADIKNRLPKN